MMSDGRIAKAEQAELDAQLQQHLKELAEIDAKSAGQATKEHAQEGSSAEAKGEHPHEEEDDEEILWEIKGPTLEELEHLEQAKGDAKARDATLEAGPSGSAMTALNPGLVQEVEELTHKEKRKAVPLDAELGVDAQPHIHTHYRD